MKRIPQLDSVRALAVIAVFLFHSLGVKLLWAGVDLFFILSGFLITNVLLEAKRLTLGSYFGHFYARRVRRILPPYVLTLAVVSLFVGVGWTHYWYLYILLTNLLYPLHIQIPVAFGPLWSLAVEEQFYLAWPFAVYFLTERQLRSVSMLLIVIAPLLRATIHFSDPWVMYMLTPFRMDLLASGALLCLVWRNKPEVITERGSAVGISLLALGLATFAVLGQLGITKNANTATSNVLVYEASLAVCFGFILYALAGRRVGWLRLGALRFVGKISFTMYLVHQGILELLRHSLKGIPLTLVGLLVALVYASLSWYLMERRLLQAPEKPTLPVKTIPIT